MPRGGRNGFAHGRHFGLFIYEGPGGEGDVREVVGKTVAITFEIVDDRPMEASAEAGKPTAGSPSADGAPPSPTGGQPTGEPGFPSADEPGRDDRHGRRQYVVTVSVGSNTVAPLRAQEYDRPGVYTLEVSLPRPMLATVVVAVVNEHGQAASAAITVSYNRRVYAALKWVAALPILLVSAGLLIAPDKNWDRPTTELPT
jgi:hypothetical protein